MTDIRTQKRVYKTCYKVTFEVRLEVKSCQKDPQQWSNTIQIHPVGIEEKLTATVFLDCDCPCELPDNAVSNAQTNTYTHLQLLYCLKKEPHL